MTKKIKNQMRRNSKYDEKAIFIEVDFLKNGKTIMCFSFITNKKNIDIITEHVNGKNNGYKDEVYQCLINDIEHYKNLFYENIKDYSIILTPEYEELFQEYTNMVQHYLCCYDSLLPYVEEHRDEPYFIALSVNYEDKTEHSITGVVIKEIDNEYEFTEYQLK